MADQDFDINIKTVADLTGVRKAADAIAILNEQAKKSQAEAGTAGGESDLSKIGEHIERGFLRTAIHAVGVGLFFEAIDSAICVAVHDAKPGGCRAVDWRSAQCNVRTVFQVCPQ